MQMQLLDRIAGSSALAAYFGKVLRKLQEIRAQLASMQEFGTQQQRDSMQTLVDHVSFWDSCTNALMWTDG